MKRAIIVATFVAFSISADANVTKNTKYQRLMDKIDQLELKIDRISSALGAVNSRQIKETQDMGAYADCRDKCEEAFDYKTAPREECEDNKYCDVKEWWSKQSQACYKSCDKYATPLIRASGSGC